MRAVRIHRKQDLRVDDVAPPVPGPRQLVVEPAFVGICGSDLHYLSDGAAGIFRIAEPLIPGHETAGVVAEDPTGTHAVGTRVAVHPATWGPACDSQSHGNRHTWPGGSFLGSASTTPHTQGAMAERLVVDVDQVRPLPDDLPLRRAALAEPLAVGLHALVIAGGIEGKRVLVSGAGPIGLLAAGAALAQGAESVWCADVRDAPLRRASALGCDGVLNVSTDRIPESAFDVTLECAGVPESLHALLLATRRGGVLVQVGNVPNQSREVNLAPIVSKEIQLRGTFRFDTEIDDAIALLATSPQLEGVITHEHTLENSAEAFAVAADSDASGKVLIRIG